jgi:branched-chain amino acid aminotransferase
MAVTYVNGQYVNADEAVLPINDLAVIRGFGAFDFLRTYGGKPFRLTANIERLRRSCALITLPFPWSNEEIADIVYETLRRNDLPEANIRILVTGGVSPDFFNPTGESTLAVMVAPLRPLAPEIYEKGAKAVTVRMDRIVHGAKSINYIPGIIAMNQARAANAIEALYLNANDDVLEGTTTNLFIVKNGTLITPEDTVLPGITRNVVLELTEGEIPTEIRAIPRSELYGADEAFITASNKQIVPIVQVDDATIGAGVPGPITRRVMELFHAETARTAVEA